MKQMREPAFEKIKMPARGERIELRGDKLSVPASPVIPYIEGDGIGPDIMKASMAVFNAAAELAGGGKKVEWLEIFAGEKAEAVYGSYLPDDTLRAIEFFGVALKGPLTTPVGGGFRSLNVAIRQKLDLYACVRPVRYFPGVPSPLKNPENLDVVIFRENTEDVYAGYEWESGSDEARAVIRHLNGEHGTKIDELSGIGVKPISEKATKRLMRKAMEYALEKGRKSVTVVHKGNIMKFTEGAFHRWAFETAEEEFSGVSEFEGEGAPDGGKIIIRDRIADNMFQQVLTRAGDYDVIVCPNLNGDYLSDACAAQVGGLGIAPGANMGEGTAVFEATHGTAPKYAGMDRVNPGSLILSGAMLFEYIGWSEVAGVIESAFGATVAEKRVTYDLARQMDGAEELKTSEFASAIIGNMRAPGA